MDTPSTEFSGWPGRPVYRPIVVVTMPYYKNPYRWHKVDSPPEIVLSALKVFRTFVSYGDDEWDEENKDYKVKLSHQDQDVLVYVFPNKHGKPFKDIKRSFERALKEAKIEQGDDRRHKIVFHTLQHTCVSLLTERGADTTAVKNYVAHASEEMTKHCTHLSEEYARRTAEILNGLCGVISVYGNNG